MLKVGVTGGIGSGKSVVCRVFHTLGIPVLNADEVAAHLLETDNVIKQQVIALLGTGSYKNDLPDRAFIGGLVFNDPAKLQALNAIIHPATIARGKQWMQEQTGPYAIKEAAIFFESGTNLDMDIMVGVFAPVELRISRALSRSGSTREDILNRMTQQMDEDEKMKRCDYVIINDGMQAILPQVLNLHKIFSEKA